MSKIIYNLVYNRKRSLNKKGMALVQVEAYLDRKKKYFSTKVYLKPEQWDNKRVGIVAARKAYFIRVTKGGFEHKRKQNLFYFFL